jgi:phosphoglycerate-specific signal transduction histidine kinase
MEVNEKLDEIVGFVEAARTMPMSSSAMINKQDLIAMLDELRERLPANLQAADAVLAEREGLLIEAQENAAAIIADARAEQARLVADHEVLVEARIERDRIVDIASEQAAGLRHDIDHYVDAKLANLEAQAERIAETVRSGRDRLRRKTPFDELAAGDADLTPLPGDGEPRRSP